jgi:hypothetical protein
MIEASTPGLDAMAAKQARGLNLLQENKAEAAAQAQKEKERSDAAKQQAAVGRDNRHLSRDIKRAQLTGRVSNFVRDYAMRSSAVNQATTVSGKRVDYVDLPNVGAIDISSGQIIRGELFKDTTSQNVSSGEASAVDCGLGLYLVGDSIWVHPGTVAGQLPPGVDPIKGKFVANGGSGQVYAGVRINSTGAVTTVILSGGSTPGDTDTAFYLTLGGYAYDGSNASYYNYGCGSVTATICRNWFKATAPFYGVTLAR